MDAAYSSIVFVEPARAEANLALVERRLPSNLWATLPALLAQLPDPDGALNFLERYLRLEAEPTAANARTIAYLKRHPAELHHLLVIFSYSRFLPHAAAIHLRVAIQTKGSRVSLIMWTSTGASSDHMKRGTIFGGRSCSTSQEMHRNQYYAHDQRNVNEPGGYVKREKAKEPQNNQNQSEYRQHVVFSSFIVLRSAQSTNNYCRTESVSHR